MSIIIGIDHGYYAIKTAHCSFPAGLTSYGEHEPYTRQGLLELAGCFFVCGTGRQPIQRDKTANDNYYLLTLAAIAKEIKQRDLPPECSVRIAAGLPLASFGRDKPKFRDYLFRSRQPLNFRFEGTEYRITIEDVAIFPQGYAALMTETGLLQDEPSMLLMDLGGWTVDLIGNSKSDTHFVVVYGYTSTANSTDSFLVLDPYGGSKKTMTKAISDNVKVRMYSYITAIRTNSNPIS